MKRSTRKRLKVFLFSVLAAGVVVFFAGVSFAGDMDMRKGAPDDPAAGRYERKYDPAARKDIGPTEGRLMDAFYAPAKGAGVGVPTAGSVETLTAANGHVRFGADEGARSEGKNAPRLAGFEAISFEDGDGKSPAGGDVLDLAIGRDAHFEAQDFTVTTEGISLCY